MGWIGLIRWIGFIRLIGLMELMGLIEVPVPNAAGFDRAMRV